jgi:hypothetical protein
MATLIIEDGSARANADSYATAAELATYAAAFGFTVPAAEADREVLLRRAAQAMNGLNWKGDRRTSTQSLAWPRKNVVRDGELIATITIPREILYGQMASASEIYASETGAAVAPPKGPVVRERVDVLEVEYAAPTVVHNTGHVLGVAANAQSSTLFADFLKSIGLRAVRL